MNLEQASSSWRNTGGSDHKGKGGHTGRPQISSCSSKGTARKESGELLTGSKCL